MVVLLGCTCRHTCCATRAGSYMTESRSRRLRARRGRRGAAADPNGSARPAAFGEQRPGAQPISLGNGDAAGLLGGGTDPLAWLEQLLALPIASFSETLDAAAQLVADVFGADKVDVWFPSETGAELVALGTSQTAMARQERALGLDRLPLAGKGRVVEVFLSGVPFATGHADRDLRVEPGFTQQLGVRSMLCVRLEVAGEHHGVLLVSSARPQAYAEGALRLLSTMARFVGRVARRAELEQDLAYQRSVAAERAELLELAPVGIFVRDLRTSAVRYWSRGAADLYGWEPEEAVGQVSHALLQTRFPEPLATIEATVLGTGRWEGELIQTTRAGRQVVVASRWALERDQQGEPVAFLEVNTDLTTAKRAEAARAELAGEQAARQAAEASRQQLEALVAELHASQEQFRATFEQAAVGMAHVALDGRWLRVNQRLCQLVGYSAEELLLQRTFQDITYPPDLHADLRQHDQLLAGAIDTYTLDRRYVRKDGSLVWITLTVALVRRANGQPHYLLAVIQDIDARKRAEEQVRSQAARQMLLAETSQAFATAGLNTRLLLDTIARRVGEALGDTCVVRLLVADGPLLEPATIYHREPAVASLVQELLAQTPARLDQGLTAEVMRTGQVVRVPELTLDEQRQRLRPVYWPFLERVGISSALLAPLRVGSRVLGTLGISRDQPGRPYTEDDAVLLQELADRAALALEAGRRFEQAMTALRARDEVLGVVSHDLKTPLAAISGSAQLLQRRLRRAGMTDERLVQSVERIVGASRRMAHMMDELVDTARLEAGQPLALRRAPTDLVELVQAAVADQETAAERHVLRVSASAPHLVGDWDPARVQRVVDNLLSNAIKYSAQGGDVDVEVSVEEGAGAQWAVMRVTDQGIGIPAADLPRIFERFRRGQNVAGIEGTGLGLSGAKQIVEQHGGTLEVQSEEERGSTFTVRLPLPAEHRSP